jgi:hypothetical protein
VAEAIRSQETKLETEGIFMSALRNAVLATIIATFANTASAQIGGMAISFGCKPDASRGAVTIACAKLEVGDRGCPSDYEVDGDYCIAKNPNTNYQVVIRNTCPVGHKMHGARCKFSDDKSRNTSLDD